MIETLPKNYKIKEQPIVAAFFLKNKTQKESLRLFELYEKCIIQYSNTQRKEPVKKIAFDFDLIFEMIRVSEEESKKKLGRPCGLKFQKEEECYYLFSDEVIMLANWRDILAKKLNQRGFHELFKPIKKIGKGNFASVYLAIRLEDDKKFAIKAFSKEATYAEDKGKQSLINQIQLMRKFYHKNLMKLYEVYESENSIYVSVELLEGGQLYDKIKAKHKFTSDEVHTMIRGLLMGLEHMHAKRVMHRDLKPENILLRKENDYDCVVADFGLATWADQPEYLFVRCGTPGYVAPEIVNIKDMKAKCDPICDVFSLGVIFHIVLTGKSPFPGKTYNQVLAQNRACNINFEIQQLQKLPQITLDLLKKMLDKNPKTRITAAEALKHAFFEWEIKNITNSQQLEETQQENVKLPFNKTSILMNKNSIVCNSPLMTSANPLRKAGQASLLRDDSCLKFKMKETVLTGKTDTYDTKDSIDSPNMVKHMTILPKESRFGQQRKVLEKRDSN